MDPALLLLVGLFAIILLQVLRTRRVQRQAKETRESVRLGSSVVTTAGLLGTVVDLDEESVTIESTPGGRSRWVRAAIARVTPPAEGLEEPPPATGSTDEAATDTDRRTD